jgi:hypothetical protein
MKTNWRELRDTLFPEEPSIPFVPKIPRVSEQEEALESGRYGEDKKDKRDKSVGGGERMGHFGGPKWTRPPRVDGGRMSPALQS